MLTDGGLRDLLRAGYETSDADFVAHPIEKVSRAVYFMAVFLRESRYRSRHKFISSVDLQHQIDDQLQTTGHMATDKKFNQVDWFSEQWTIAVKGKPTTPYFLNEYRELFDRQGENPTSYRITPALHDSVVRTLSDLAASTPYGSTVPPTALDPEAPNTISVKRPGETALPSVNRLGQTIPDLPGLVEELNNEGVFEPISIEDARVRALRAIIIRQGQPQFRAALLAAYGGCCAITKCDAAPALEAAHVTPYEGLTTNTVSNGILLRADIHTLFDLDLIGIDPGAGLVHISKQLEKTVYWEFEGTPLRRPFHDSAAPNRNALEWRWECFLRR